MKLSINALWVIIAFCSFEIGAAEPIRIIKPDIQGTISMDGAPPHVTELINQIKTADMKDWILSEEKGSKWIVRGVTIIDVHLVSVSLSDGNGSEDILFDRDLDKRWIIIRRLPLGDWKPVEQRRGDRLSNLRFP